MSDEECQQASVLISTDYSDILSGILTLSTRRPSIRRPDTETAYDGHQPNNLLFLIILGALCLARVVHWLAFGQPAAAARRRHPIVVRAPREHSSSVIFLAVSSIV